MMQWRCEHITAQRHTVHVSHSVELCVYMDMMGDAIDDAMEVRWRLTAQQNAVHM
jgi:hypothetical protein